MLGGPNQSAKDSLKIQIDRGVTDIENAEELKDIRASLNALKKEELFIPA